MTKQSFEIETRDLGTYYVVASDAGKAYDLVRRTIESWKLGTPNNYALKTAHLLAQQGQFQGINQLPLLLIDEEEKTNELD